MAGTWQLELTLRDPTGAPVADAQVDVHRRQPDGVHTDVRTEVHERTDTAGRAVLRGTHRGEKLLRVRAKARSLAQLTHTLAITEPGPHALELTLAQGRAVAGVVRAAADGSPIAGLMITAEQVPQGEHGAEEIGFVATDTEGRFRIEGCGAGPVRLSGHGEQWSRFVAEGFTPGEQIELALKRRGDPTARGMHLGEIHGRVVDAASGRDVDVSRWAVDVELFPPEVADWRTHVLSEILNPRPVQRAMFGPLPPPSPVFWVDDLPAGRYVLVVRHPGYAPSLAGPFEVGPGRLIADVAIALAPGGTVTGDVRDANGRPVAKACVWVTAAADPTGEAREAARALAGGDRYPTYRYSLTDAQGRLRLEHLPAGVTLRCVAADGEAGIALSAPFVLENGRTLTVELQLTR